MGQVLLLGDSIFDNKSYVGGGAAVIEHLRESLPVGWGARLGAVDGAVVASMAGQIMADGVRGGPEATHVVLSVGGNNALGYAHEIRTGTARTYAEVLERLAEIQEEFRAEYRELLGQIVRLGKVTIVCTIYDAIPVLSAMERTALGIFNDVILREAFRAGVAVLDLRLVCDDAGDYSAMSPIEPSVAGGRKIAAAIVRAVTDLGPGAARVFTRAE